MLTWKFRLSCLSLLALIFCNATSRAERLRLPAALQAQVNEAVDRGIVFLFKTQGIWGTWTDDAKKHPIGYAALPGLTLLECGEPKDHPAVRPAASFVRQNCARLDATYELALAILFLDRLGDPADEKLIQTLALRLIAGQSSTGGWNYHCPILSSQQSQQLLAALRGDFKKASASLAPLRNLPVNREPSDNSNSQFATLALWVAQRHGLPVRRTLARIALRFDTSQNRDGSWGYRYRYGGGEPESPSMTCVGLLGLAIGHGVAADNEANEIPTLALDRAQAAAVAAFHPPSSFLLLALERVERKQARERAKKRGNDPRILNGFLALSKHVGEPVGRTKAIPQHDLYFMWSLERVAVLYDLPDHRREGLVPLGSRDAGRQPESSRQLAERGLSRGRSDHRYLPGLAVSETGQPGHRADDQAAVRSQHTDGVDQPAAGTVPAGAVVFRRRFIDGQSGEGGSPRADQGFRSGNPGAKHTGHHGGRAAAVFTAARGNAKARHQKLALAVRRCRGGPLYCLWRTPGKL